MIRDSIELIEEKVKRVHIGTHSGVIHEELVALFTSPHWQILLDVPPHGQFQTQWVDFRTIDGMISVVNKKKTIKRFCSAWTSMV